MRTVSFLIASLVVVCLVGCSGGGATKDEATAKTEVKAGDVNAKTETKSDGTQVTTAETPEGKTTVEQKGDEFKMKVEGKDGEQTWEAGKNADLSGMTVPLYPGAARKDGGKVTMGDQTQFGVMLETGDAVDKVADYYKAQLKDPTVTSTAGTTAVIGTAKGGGQAMIGVTREGNVTKVSVAETVTKKP
ncbi:MAG: hypothetical protein KIS66_11175 [Fimbriimonadaceae bacterium]|nr:hypothetical protein [Fimbriimonadaceae bacterium]